MSVKELNTLKDLDAVLKDSAEKPVFLFKHSTRCPISVAANTEYEEFTSSSESKQALCTYLDLLSHRDISAEIAVRTEVQHQSPQAILVVGGEARWSATHSSITASALKEALAGLS